MLKRHAIMLRIAMHPDVCDRRSIAEIVVNMVFIFRGSSRALRAVRYCVNFGTTLPEPVVVCDKNNQHVSNHSSVPARRFDRLVVVFSCCCGERSGEDGCFHSILERAAAAWKSQVRV